MSDILSTIKEKFFKQEPKERSNQVRLDSPGADFIPYACHYNMDTVLTKNGELLQTIKIVGLSHEILGQNNLSLRETIRKVILEQVKLMDFAVHFHTIRKKANLDNSPEFPGLFSRNLHDEWVEKNNWNHRFSNELYVTFICAGMPANVTLKNFSSMFFVDSLIKEHNKYIDDNCIKLTKLTNSILETLSDFGAVKLKIVPDDELGYKSELVSFFGNIIQLDDSSVAVKKQDVSKQLSKYKVAFGNNALEVKSDGKRLFGTMLSIKGCSGVSNKAIDRFLQSQCQFVISQTMNFGNNDNYIKFLEKQEYMLEISGDSEFRDISGLQRILSQVRQDKNTGLCESQASIMVIADSIDELEEDTKKVSASLGAIGIPVIREDVNMEHCFWAQLPANFAYINRKRSILSSRLGHFASLRNFPFGSLTSKWGEYITLLRTNLGTTYFFNFHVDHNGHTIIIGDSGSGKKTLLNFLLAEASKLKPKLLYLDSDTESKLYIEARGGSYKEFSFDPEANTLKLNPLLLEDTKENREYLQYWFLYLLDKYADPTDVEKYLEALKVAIDKVYELPKESRRLSNIKEFFVDPAFADLNKKIIKSLSQWHSKGKLSHIFDNDTDDLMEHQKSKVMGIDMTSIYDTPMGMNLPVLNYVLQYFVQYCTGSTPSILAIADGNRLFNSIYFEKNLSYILDDLEKNNSIMLATASFSSEKVNWSATIGDIYNQKMQTKIFLADGSSLSNVDKIFSLSGDERMYLEAFDLHSREFIIRQDNASIVSTLDLTEFTHSLDILSGSKRAHRVVSELKSKHGDDFTKWLPRFYEYSEV